MHGADELLSAGGRDQEPKETQWMSVSTPDTGAYTVFSTAVLFPTTISAAFLLAQVVIRGQAWILRLFEPDQNHVHELGMSAGRLFGSANICC